MLDPRHGASTRRKLAELAVVALAAITGAALLLGRARVEPLGASLDVEFTLKRTDAGSLACAGDLHASRGGVEYRCAFDANRRRRDGVRRPLQPVVTTAGRVVVLGGLFDVPGVRTASARRKRESTTVRCRAEVLAHAPRIDVRFADDGSWDSRRKVVVAAPQSCRIVR